MRRFVTRVLVLLALAETVWLLYPVVRARLIGVEETPAARGQRLAATPGCFPSPPPGGGGGPPPPPAGSGSPRRWAPSPATGRAEAAAPPIRAARRRRCRRSPSRR